MSDVVSVPLEDVRIIASKYPDSYFAGAVSFAESCGREDIELSASTMKYMYIANELTFSENTEEFSINKDDVTRNLLRCALETNKDKSHVLKTYIPEMIRLQMYEEYQTYVFSQLSANEIEQNHGDIIFPIEFLTAYPYRCINSGTMLMYYAHYKNAKVCLELLKSGKAEPGHTNIFGNTALIFACCAGLSDVAMAILATGCANVEQVNVRGENALMCACYTGLSEVALAILATGLCDVKQINTFGSTSLQLACAKRMSEVALAILATECCNLEYVCWGGTTPLMLACMYGLKDVALAILATGSGIPEHVSDNGNTALIYACWGNDTSAVALAIIATGHANPEQINKEGMTALKYAKMYKMHDVIAKLQLPRPGLMQWIRGNYSILR